MVLTDEQRKFIRDNRAAGQSWNWIAQELGMKVTTMRRLFDPEYRETRNNISIRSYHNPAKRPPANFVRSHIDRNPIYDPQRDAPLYRENTTAELMGDPPAGRSALDRKRGTFALGGRYEKADD